MSINVCNDRSMASITSLPSGVSGSSLVLIKTLTASGDNELDFNDGSSDVVLDSTYKEYIFKFINIHPSTKSHFAMNLRTGSSGSYSAASKTTTFFTSHHAEDDSPATLQYSTGSDLAQSTGDQRLIYELNTDNDSSVSGEMHLFEPSSTTFVKNFFSRCNSATDDGGDMSLCAFSAGYANTTSARTSVRFKMVAGTLDSGTIKLYGVS